MIFPVLNINELNAFPRPPTGDLGVREIFVGVSTSIFWAYFGLLALRCRIFLNALTHAMPCYGRLASHLGSEQDSAEKPSS